ncbi:hypothetical protein OH76DRAFT_1403392 [Lentinus brumalis]|uniref:MYND-type domain-containing protein n=1 Tax=Lentinus brumalis TaxID=2498619 RepID=A0A371DBF2_9APHY|nr:hypothetical protein OH76DRAFT_1403392 [Polyporus brumalis]
MFDLACVESQWELCDAIMRIWLDICADAVLCRVFLDRDLFSKVLQVMENADPSILLQLLSILARHGDDKVRTDVLHHLPDLLRMQWDPWMCDEPDNDEFLVITLCHCIGTSGFPADPEQIFPANLSVNFVADVALHALEASDVSYDLIIHAFPLLIICVQACPPEEYKTRSRILDFLAVLLHSNDVVMRCVAAWVFCGLPPTEQRSRSDYASRMGTVELVNFPELALLPVPPKSERASIRTSTFTVRSLLRAVHMDGDLYKFGLGMVPVLLNRPLLYNDGDFPPFKDSTLIGLDSLLAESAEILRRRGDQAHRDTADTLTLEHLARSGQSDAAASYAREVLKRNPQHRYAHVTLCEQSEDREEALQTARKGLRLGHLTPYLRRRLFVSAIELSHAKGQTLLLQAGPSDWRRRRAALECLLSAWKIDRAFVPTAPIDMPQLQHATELSIMYHLILEGNCLPGYPPIQPLLDRIDESTRTLESAGFKVSEGSIREGRKALLHHFSQGYDKWAAFVERFDQIDEENRAFGIHERPGTTAKARAWFPRHWGRADGEEDEQDGDEYAQWWTPENTPTLKSLLGGPLRCSCHSSEDGCVQLAPGLAMLYACSWCSTRTVIVRRCSGCEDAWYCDSHCQRAHWPKHRLVCRYRE